MPTQITGIDETIAGFNSINSKIGPALAQALDQAANLFVQKAQSRAPVRTGYLRDHIKVTEKNEDHAVITSEADYSIYVEEGTYKMAARPFMQNTASEVEQEFKSAIGAKIKAIVSEVFR